MTTRIAPLAVALPVLLSGCGRRATAADCQLIVDKSVELQMKSMSETDPAAVEERESHIRGELEPELQSCESRRVTARTMSCVQSAKTTQELDRCLR